MTVRLKRVYDTPSAQDGARVLVDRLWPRGLTKEEAALDAWLSDIAPSHELRKWYHAHPSQWTKFRKQYLSELSNDAAHELLQRLHDLAGKRAGLTLLFASKDLEQITRWFSRNWSRVNVSRPPARGPRWQRPDAARAARRR